ncbi:hypothetical protein EJB05_53876, partial [Eragrostis curvula]
MAVKNRARLRNPSAFVRLAVSLSLPTREQNTLSSPVANILSDLTLPGLHFEPVDDEIVKLYLLPRVRGQLDLFPGLIVDDDTAANTQPWELFDRHGLPDEDGAQAFFFVHGGARPDRRCQGGGTWKSQKINHEMVVVHGEAVNWSRHNLNFHMDMESGSKGWVMHEYTVAGSSLKLCSISFSGYGHKRKRVPDQGFGEPSTRRPRVGADESGSDTSGSGTKTAFDQGFSTAHASEHGELPHDSSDEEIAAEMIAEMTCEQPSWEFQAEQVQQTINASAPQEFHPPPWTTTTTFSQQSSLAQEDDAAHASEGIQHLADTTQDIAAMIDEMIDTDPYLAQAPVMDPSSCGGVSNIGDTDAVHWEGIDFTFSYDEDNSTC